jgi:hypothetical protein
MVLLDVVQEANPVRDPRFGCGREYGARQVHARAAMAHGPAQGVSFGEPVAVADVAVCHVSDKAAHRRTRVGPNRMRNHGPPFDVVVWR